MNRKNSRRVKKAGKVKIQQKGVIRPAVRMMFQNFFHHNVGHNAAALAYYLLFALFPLMIFLSNLLGLLDLNIATVIHVLQRFLPGEIVGLVESYLDYVSHTSSPVLMWFALVFTIWFPMRATKGLMDAVRQAYQLEKPKSAVSYTARQLIYTVVLLLVIGMTLILATLGKHVLGYINYLLPENSIKIPGYLLTLWQYIRFIPIGLLMFAALGALYEMSLDSREKMKDVMPGIVMALSSWMIVSIGFSFYVENLADFSLIYGTLGAVIVLLMWLYMTAVILIMGAELNGALTKVRREKELFAR